MMHHLFIGFKDVNTRVKYDDINFNQTYCKVNNVSSICDFRVAPSLFFEPSPP